MGSMNYAKYSSRRTRVRLRGRVRELVRRRSARCWRRWSSRASGPSTSASTPGTWRRSIRCWTWACSTPPLQVSFVMGVTGGIRPTARNVAHMAEQVPPTSPHQWGVIGISRAQWTLLAAALSLGGNVRVGPGGQLLPARRGDGALQRRPGGAGGADGGGCGAAARDGGRGAGAARASVSGARRACASSTSRGCSRPVLLAPARRPRRRRDQGRGPRRGRLRARGLRAVVRGAQPRQALDPARPEVRRRAGRVPATGAGRARSCSSRSGRA